MREWRFKMIGPTLELFCLFKVSPLAKPYCDEEEEDDCNHDGHT